ncbi:MAG: phage tail tip lysozyme [bacterium]|nr:phage tail tip lysozyme [bacterium]
MIKRSLIIVLSLLLSGQMLFFSLGKSASAISQVDHDAIFKGTTFYEDTVVCEPSSTVNGPSVTASCVCPTTGSYALTGSGTAEIVWGYLINKVGFTPIQAAGAMGNILAESGFNPEAINPTSGAYGLIQWLGGRLTGLENFATSQGKDKSDLELQLDYMKQELETSYKTSVLDPMLASDDLTETTRIWLEHYEIPCVGPGAAACFDKKTAERSVESQKYLAEYGSTTVPSTSNGIGCVTEGGQIVGGYSLPLDRTWFEDHPDWLTKPHHDYPASDLGVPVGTPVYSMSDGVIRQSGGGCGIGVSVDTDDGYTLNYCHGSDGGSVEGAKPGDRVSAGQLIMHSANTGHSTGPHLHLGIIVNGTKVCPQPLFQAIYNGTAIPKLTDLPSSGCIGASLR